FMCEGINETYQEACEHIMCEECVLKLSNGGERTKVCGCAHVLDVEGDPILIPVRSEQTTYGGTPGAGSGQSGGDDLRDCVKLMATAIDKLANKETSSSYKPRSILKTESSITFPKGSAEALEDLDKWLQEFDRINRHACGSEVSLPADRIHHLLSCWEVGTVVGDMLRMDQVSPEYQALEADGALEECWQMLLKRLNEFREPPVVVLRKARDKWQKLYWTGDPKSFHLLFRQAIAACARAHVPKTDYDAVLKYLELIPPEVGKEMEKKLEMYQLLGKFAQGWDLASLMVEVDKHFSLEKTYPSGSDTGGLDRNRAVWANDKKCCRLPWGCKRVQPPIPRV
ncbi:MAG: hypothetical protein QGH77_08050, partial [Planctomycetota bacterium]|nr:hypothetical protein [Planctomycetota bacterium]